MKNKQSLAGHTGKIVFILLIFIILVFGLFSVLANTPLELISNNNVVLVNVVQRLLGLWVYLLMFIQIILGNFMTKLTEKLGGWIFKSHIILGISIYFLILVHILSYIVINYLVGHGFDPFYVFADVCLLCDSTLEFYLNFGRIAFWLITITVFVGYFRTANQFLRIHWKKFHLLNYIAFLIVGIHSYFVGTDVLAFPFSIFYYPSLIIILGLTISKGYSLLRISKGKVK